MPYKSSPGRPGQRLVPVRGLLGGSVLVSETKKPPSPQMYGRDAEKKAVQELKAAGWTVTHSHLSRGAADIVATKLENGVLATTRVVQVKATSSFRPSFMNSGIREILTAPPVQLRECWGYILNRGHAITVSIDPDNSFRVIGKEPYRTAVEDAVVDMLVRGIIKREQLRAVKDR